MNIDATIVVFSYCLKGNVQVEIPQGRNTDAVFRGGLTRSSDEAPVMGVERRG